MSLALLLDMAASGHGDRIALGTGADGLSLAGTARRAAGAASVVRERGGGCVAFVGRNGPAFPQVLFAAALAGVPFAPLNYRLGPEQLNELLGQLDRPVVVADDDYL